MPESSICISLKRTVAGQLFGKLTATVSFEICNAKGEEFVSTEKREIEFGKSLDSEFPNFICVKELERKLQNSPEDHLTIRCLMTMQKSVPTENPSKRSCTAATEIGFNSFCFVWSLRLPISSDRIATKTFPINDYNHLNIDVKAPYDNFLIEIVHIIKRSQFTFPLLRVKCQIALLNRNRLEKLSRTDYFTFEEGSSVWHFPSFLKKSMLDKKYVWSYLKFNFFISNGSSINKYIEEPEQHNMLSFAASSKNVTSTDHLIEDLRAMLLSKEHSDVSFRVEGELVGAHKSILASRSPVFSAMFNQKMAEHHTGVVEITDMDVQILKSFLEFLYTGEIENLDCDKALELLVVGDKYQVLSLKEKCSETLRHRLSCGNACDVVSVADMVEHQILKTFAIDYMKENSTEILGTTMWMEWIKKNPPLCSEILQSLSLDLKTIQKKK